MFSLNNSQIYNNGYQVYNPGNSFCQNAYSEPTLLSKDELSNMITICLERNTSNISLMYANKTSEMIKTNLDHQDNQIKETKSLLRKLKNNFTKKYSSYVSQMEKLDGSTSNILDKINSYIEKYEEVEKILINSFEITERDINFLFGIIFSVEQNIKLKCQLNTNYSNCNLSELKRIIQERILELGHEIEKLDINNEENLNYDDTLIKLKKINSYLEYENNNKKLKIEKSSFKVSQNKFTKPKNNFAFYN